MKPILYIYERENILRDLNVLSSFDGYEVIEQQGYDTVIPQPYAGLLWYPDRFDSHRIFALHSICHPKIMLLKTTDPIRGEQRPRFLPLPPQTRILLVPFDLRELQLWFPDVYG
jgi:hypothetical protein